MVTDTSPDDHQIDAPGILLSERHWREAAKIFLRSFIVVVFDEPDHFVHDVFDGNLLLLYPGLPEAAV